MTFLDFIRKVHKEKRERQRFILKGGKGSGWFAPPKGTHGKGRTKTQIVGSGKVTAHIIKPGGKLPKLKTRQEAIILFDTHNRLVVGDRNRTHAELINQIGENKNFDHIIRGGVTRKKGKLQLEVWTSYSGIGQNIFGTDADIAAARNIKKLTRAMVSAGYPSNMKLVWYPIVAKPISSTVGVWKTIQEEKVLTALARKRRRLANMVAPAMMPASRASQGTRTTVLSMG